MLLCNIKALKTPSVSNLLIDFDEDMSITTTDGLQVLKASEIPSAESEQVTTGSHPVVKLSDSLKEFLSASKVGAKEPQVILLTTKLMLRNTNFRII